MGRYYSGDIEGKFWFGIQSSNSADRFGVIGDYPQYLEYYFNEDHIPCVKKELLKIKKTYGEDIKLMKKFMEKNNSYNYDMLIKFCEENGKPKTETEIKQILEELADYELGEKILKHLEENGECFFSAEL